MISVWCFLEEGSLVASIESKLKKEFESGIMCRLSGFIATHSYLEVAILISELLSRKIS